MNPDPTDTIPHPQLTFPASPSEDMGNPVNCNSLSPTPQATAAALTQPRQSLLRVRMLIGARRSGRWPEGAVPLLPVCLQLGTQDSCPRPQLLPQELSLCERSCGEWTGFRTPINMAWREVPRAALGPPAWVCLTAALGPSCYPTVPAPAFERALGPGGAQLYSGARGACAHLWVPAHRVRRSPRETASRGVR